MGAAISDPPSREERHRRGRRCCHSTAVKRWVRCDPRHSGRHGTCSSCGAFIEIMSAAFVAACDALHLKISDPAARFVAEKVIELAQRGIRDPDVLRTMTLREFGLSDENADSKAASER